MSPDFEILEHTADAGIIAYGSDLKQAFSNAASGLFSLIVDQDSVQDTTERQIEVRANDLESLLVEWLNELIYIFDVENILFKRFEVVEIESGRLTARAYGEKVDPTRHEVKLGVKAATYHMLRIEKNNGYKLQVIFDI
ncbi:MAG: hypothetical protein HW384_376 [Dehalococcoidia bacterium]|nr:hypothetical protein [Dehalococcoidia bacterium]